MNPIAVVGAISALLAIASILGATVAVYRSSIVQTALREQRAANADLRADVEDERNRRTALEEDHQRNERQHAVTEAALRTRLAVTEEKLEGCEQRVHVLEDLLSKRADDAEIRKEIAEVRAIVDKKVITHLTTIHQMLQRLEKGSAAR